MKQNKNTYIMKTKILFNLLLLFILGTGASLAQPAWTVTPQNFQYSMTVIASVEINSLEVQNTTSIVGAFYNNECRGVATLQAIPVDGNPDVYRAFLTIYSNVPLGEEIAFKFYNAPINYIHDVSTTVSFFLDINIGSIDTPQVLVALAADNNTTPTVKPGHENVVKNIAADFMLIERGSSTLELFESLDAPKNPAGTIVGSLVMLDDLDAPLVPGAELVTSDMKVKSIAQDGSFQIYTLVVASKDALLSDIQLSVGTLTPVFAGSTLLYAVELAHGSALPTVTGIANEPHSQLVTVQILAIPGTATIEVTSEDLLHTNTYEVSFTYLPSGDEDALRALYTSTIGDNWTNHTNWLAGDPDTWFGVRMPVDQATYLNLKQNNLIGTLPLELWGLDELTFLHLSLNQLSGSIPDDIGNLTKLKFLALSGNAFTGPLPAGIGNLIDLTEFYGNTNQFSGPLPDEMGQMVSLKYLSLQRNLFEGQLPASFVNLINLIQLNIQTNQFTGLPDLTALTKLKKLNVQKNKFDFEDLEPLADLPTLQEFIYAPQANIGTEETVVVVAGGTFTHTLTTGGSFNSYKWYKDDVLIPGATGATITITGVGSSDAGDYTCKVKNSKLPALTLVSLPVHLQVNTDGGDWETETWVLDVAPLLDLMRNQIVWTGNPAGWSKMKVYKEQNSTGSFVFSGEVDLTVGGPEYVFIDAGSLPLVHADSYKISFITSGGIESNLSSYQRTVHLTINLGVNSERNLIWTAYEGLDVDHYEILHGDIPDITTMTQLANVPGSTLSYTDFGPSHYYVVIAHFVSLPGQKAGQDLQSHSNRVSTENGMQAYTKGDILIFPNPLVQQAIIQFENPEEKACKILISDMSGKLWFRQDNITSNQITINRGNLLPGIYLIQIIGAEYSTGKMIVN